ncbi:Conserved hypothetical protein [Escherichia coli CFT073]|uniref:Uncharacterized protein n=2 Tax=Escherichia coli TaxID=562 RepID=A0A0H2V4X4_ECOL6|nr:Conserved hypothetical protein [Escherichia coli CFT073]ABE05999.1 conserved hypothetical protein [Escherichia coli UTI89]
MLTAGWFASEWHLKARRQLHSGGYRGHFFFLRFFNTTCCVVECCSHQVFQHLFVVFQQARVDLYATAVVCTVDGHFYQTCARFAGDFQLRDLFLHFLHFFLHLLGLLHQVTQTAFTKHRFLSQSR